jgi:hypothetical protein
MFLYILDNTFLLYLTLESPKGAFNRFTIENPNFCQCLPPYMSTSEYGRYARCLQHFLYLKWHGSAWFVGSPVDQKRLRAGFAADWFGSQGQIYLDIQSDFQKNLTQM